MFPWGQSKLIKNGILKGDEIGGKQNQVKDTGIAVTYTNVFHIPKIFCIHTNTFNFPKANLKTMKKPSPKTEFKYL